MSIQRINPDTLVTPGAPYHAVVRKGNIVTTSGQIAFDVNGNLVGEGDIKAQTQQTLENVKHALEAAGATLDDVVKTTVFITDLANFKAMNEGLRRVFRRQPASPFHRRRRAGAAYLAG